MKERSIIPRLILILLLFSGCQGMYLTESEQIYQDSNSRVITVVVDSIR